MEHHYPILVLEGDSSVCVWVGAVVLRAHPSSCAYTALVWVYTWTWLISQVTSSETAAVEALAKAITSPTHVLVQGCQRGEQGTEWTCTCLPPGLHGAWSAESSFGCNQWPTKRGLFRGENTGLGVRRTGVWLQLLKIHCMTLSQCFNLPGLQSPTKSVADYESSSSKLCILS